VTDEERERRELTRRAMLRASAAVPLAVALGGIAAACGGGDGGGGLVPDGSTTTVPGQTVPGGGPVHEDFSDGGTHTDTVHVDTPHGDAIHTDATPPRSIHDDNGPHCDMTEHVDHDDQAAGIYVDNTGVEHCDSGLHLDSTVEVPGDHEDVAHVDTPHGDS
jgi:hypothetical protein